MNAVLVDTSTLPAVNVNAVGTKLKSFESSVTRFIEPAKLAVRARLPEPVSVQSLNALIVPPDREMVCVEDPEKFISAFTVTPESTKFISPFRSKLMSAVPVEGPIVIDPDPDVEGVRKVPVTVMVLFVEDTDDCRVRGPFDGLVF